MTIATLIILAHLDGFPSYQRRIRHSGLSVMACMMLSQIAAAEWTGDNPGWIVERAECR